tara:strand:- start:1795 stop:2973 length:1179 start_codon:yes stop_codon:yes gene_type:complete
MVKELATTSAQKALKRLSSLDGEHRVAVGLSGGVDSSLTAALLVEAGWEVNGLTLWLMSGKGSCCSEGLVDAAGICEQLKIPHHVVDTRDTFKKEVIEEVVKNYQDGITPLPCSRCNRSVKFSEMMNWAKKNLNVDKIATGHYARIRDSNLEVIHENNENIILNKFQLLRGLDNNKDQSYFLYDLSKEILGKVIFPLGELTKEDTRREAQRYGLRTAKKEESQDLCLADHYGSMKAFLDNYIKPRRGEIVLKNGEVIGYHDGVEHFTIGQRKGLGISWKEPLHVIKIEGLTNKVIVAPREDMGKENCTVGQINWLSISPPSKPIKIEIQIRYRSKPVLAELIPIEPKKIDFQRNRPYRCLIDFEEKQFSITPGQAAVFYSGEIVLGGGLIES